jgi:hypothetical protein
MLPCVKRATEKNGTNVYVVVYNSLGVSRSTVVHLPVLTDGTYRVSKVRSSADEAKLVSASLSSFSSTKGSARYVAHFDTGPLPPLGASIFQTTLAGNTTTSKKLDHMDMSTSLMQETDHRRAGKFGRTSEDVETSNGLFSVLFDW